MPFILISQARDPWCLRFLKLEAEALDQCGSGLPSESVKSIDTGLVTLDVCPILTSEVKLIDSVYYPGPLQVQRDL